MRTLINSLPSIARLTLHGGLAPAARHRSPTTHNHTTGDAYTRSSPSVRRLADELGVDLGTVTGLGAEGASPTKMSRPLRGAAVPPRVCRSYRSAPLAKTIARAIDRSQTVDSPLLPHSGIRARWLAHTSRQAQRKDGVKVSVNDLIGLVCGAGTHQRATGQRQSGGR